ncbi:MAG: hypothetical protein FJ397_11500 [Verrucomicrobia bacterium]|nr:hypothetical protein [Verrucomicrobiota bacterium]
MHLHLGHHFYGAGNLGDDFMLGGFLEALEAQAPGTTCSCRVPFPLPPLRDRFPAVEWLPYEAGNLEPCLRRADAWLGLGGSPFQQAQSAWFLDHLTAEAAACARLGKPMFYLGVGVQGAAEAREPAVQRLIAQAEGIWTRDPAAAERLAGLAPRRPVVAASDLAHLWFRAHPPRPAVAGRLNLTPNFDFGPWPGRDALLAAVAALGVEDRVWLVQEDRELPGAERALYAGLPPAERARWRLLAPDVPGAPLTAALDRWSGAGQTVSARYHAALLGAWAGSALVVIATNEKLRGVAAALRVPAIAPDAPRAAVLEALTAAAAGPRRPPVALAEQAAAAVAACLAAIRG